MTLYELNKRVDAARAKVAEEARLIAKAKACEASDRLAIQIQALKDGYDIALD